MTEERWQYLGFLSMEYDVPTEVVLSFAEILGEDEDYDGLVTMLEDYAWMCQE